MAAVLDWLFEGPPWVQYRTRLDLLDQPEDHPSVQAARSAMLDHPQIRQLINTLAIWPGSPIQRHNDASLLIHKLSTLTDFGVRASDAGMAPITEAVLAHQSPQGAFQSLVNIPPAFGGTGQDQWAWILCDAPTLLYSLLSMGLGAEARVQQAVDHLASLAGDYGYLCVAAPELGKFRGPGRKSDPCPIANLLVLKALAQAPDRVDSPAAYACAEVILGHWEHQNDQKMYLFGIGTDFRKLKYPFIWYDLLHALEVLTRFTWLRADPRLLEMAALLKTKADPIGRFKPESIWKAWSDWDFGQKRGASQWLTLLVLRILRRLE